MIKLKYIEGEKMRFKKLLLLSLTATAITAPVIMASCSEKTEKMSNEELLSRQSDMANLFRIQAAEYLGSIRSQYSGATEQLKTLIRTLKADNSIELNFEKNKFEGKEDYSMEQWEIVGTKEDAEKKGWSDNTKTEYPAIVVDLDETFLDNTPISIRNALMNLSHNESKGAEGGWRAWVASGQAYLLPGVKEFVETAYRNGVVVLFDSDRMQDVDREGTEKSFNNWGYNPLFNKNENYWMKGVEHGKQNDEKYFNKDYYDSVEQRKGVAEKKLHDFGKNIPAYLKEVYKVEDDKLMSLAKHKEARFQYINDWTNYEIIMRVGDNIDDFNSFGTKYKLNKDRRTWLNNNMSKFTPTYAGNDDNEKYSADALYDLESIKEIRYSPKDGKEVESKEFTAGYDIYVTIGNNVNYGGWESGSIENYYGLDTAGKIDARIKGLIPTWLNEGWDGKETSEFLTKMEDELKSVLTSM
jgi:predicted secreted acid phosphatase